MENNTDFVKIELEEGIEMYVQPMGQSDSFGFASGGKNTLEGALKGLSSLSKKLKEIISSASPDETTLELSIGLKAETTGLVAVLVNGSVNSSMKVTLKWKS